ncbi:hypothetical protein DV515_00007661 [Chloebia gouldiae]|uniref:Uncharacterized protein n=1 Tax=Chloebia gouldiae TaxID=44316 RepID=A0A3L8SGR8_CHLGU|nr:hypothetical protein DV515_00007661 [Chloebia gouldiae]
MRMRLSQQPEGNVTLPHFLKGLWQRDTRGATERLRGRQRGQSKQPGAHQLFCTCVVSRLICLLLKMEYVWCWLDDSQQWIEYGKEVKFICCSCQKLLLSHLWRVL